MRRIANRLDTVNTSVVLRSSLYARFRFVATSASAGAGSCVAEFDLQTTPLWATAGRPEIVVPGA